MHLDQDGNATTFHVHGGGLVISRMVNEFGIAKKVAAAIEEAFPHRPASLGQETMPVIVVTRLRLRDPALLDEFFTDAVAAIEQALKSDGNLGADALADADNAWWSVTAWQDRRPMQAYVDTEPHLGISARLDHLLRRGHVRRLGTGQPRPAGLADQLAPPHRRR